MYECFSLSIDQNIAHIVLSRPGKRNSMIKSFWHELHAIIDKLDREARVRVIVISSSGPHFSAGLDISLFKSMSNEPSARQAALFNHTIARLQRTFTRLENCRVPVLVAIQGGCIGAALDLITACDCRYASKDSYFTIFETHLAITADVGTFPRICKLMPDGLVRELAYTGRQLSAAEAQACGLINRIFDTQEQLVSHVLDVANDISRKAPMAVHGCKKMIVHARDHSVADTLDYVALWNSAFFDRQAIAEAMQANAENRQGDFAGLPPLPQENDPDAELEI